MYMLDCEARTVIQGILTTSVPAQRDDEKKKLGGGRRSLNKKCDENLDQQALLLLQLNYDAHFPKHEKKKLFVPPNCLFFS